MTPQGGALLAIPGPAFPSCCPTGGGGEGRVPADLGDALGVCGAWCGRPVWGDCNISVCGLGQAVSL